ATLKWIDGTWLEIYDGLGVFQTKYQIAGSNGNIVTVLLGSGESSANIAVGTSYEGVLGVDAVTMRNRGRVDLDSLRTPALNGDATTIIRLNNTHADSDVTVTGGVVELNGTMFGTNVSLKNGAMLTHTTTTPATAYRAFVKLSGTLTVDAASTVDVSARGYTGSVNGIAYGDGNTTATGSKSTSGGSHGGRGGYVNAPADSASVYDSLFDPNLPGGSGSGSCSNCVAGGGVIRIEAGGVVVNGKILANGNTAEV